MYYIYIHILVCVYVMGAYHSGPESNPKFFESKVFLISIREKRQIKTLNVVVFNYRVGLYNLCT